MGYLGAAFVNIFGHSVSGSSRHEGPREEMVASTGVVLAGLAAVSWGHHRRTRHKNQQLVAARVASHETNDRYRSLFTDYPHSVYFLNLHGLFESANGAAQSLSGYDEADLTGKHFTELLAPDAWESTMALFADAAAGTPRQVRTAMRRSTGERVELSVRLAPVVVDDDIVGVFGVAEDITDQVRLEQDLHRTQEAVAAALDGVMIGDGDNLVAYVNGAGIRLHGYDSAAEMLGRPIDQFVDAVNHALLPGDVSTRHGDRGRWVGETIGRRKDGTTFVLDAAISRLPDGCVVAISRDVTARVEADAALLASEERHRLVTEVTREVMWDADLLTGRTTWTGAVRDVFGLPDDEVEIDLEWWRSRIHPDDVFRVIALREAALGSSSNQFLDEYRLRDHWGSYVTVLVQGRILRDRHGEAIRFLGSMLDITELRRQERELELARRVAEEANDAKSLFLANMSHELRTPLATVIAGAELVMDTPLTPPQQQLLERVSRAGERLLRLVDDLLDFSAIEHGEVRMDEVPFDLATVVEHAAAWAKAACREKHLDFQLAHGILPSPLLGDPDRIEQVLTNLLGNAVKFTNNGHVRLEVSAIRSDAAEADGSWVRFTVLDTGIGVDPAQQNEIFKSFQQADASITRRYGGNGLGLAISKELVDSMGGSIGVESRPGHGSSFYFEVLFGRPDTASSGPTLQQHPHGR